MSYNYDAPEVKRIRERLESGRIPEIWRKPMQTLLKEVDMLISLQYGYSMYEHFVHLYKMTYDQAAEVWVGTCPVTNQISQGRTQLECMHAVISAGKLYMETHEEQRLKGITHGVDCPKAFHKPQVTGYLHSEIDDSPYFVDNVPYCGRCHHAL